MPKGYKHNTKIKKLNAELKEYYEQNNIKPTHKWCKICETKKDINDFSKREGPIFGVIGNCKPCEVIRVGKYTSEHIEERKAYKDKYWIENGPRINKEHSDRYHSDPVYQEKMKKEDSARRRTDKYRTKNNIRHKKKYESDEAYRITYLLRGRLTDAVTRRRPGVCKKKACEYGIDWKACADHLGPRPDDINEYHIDHIIPCAAFNFTNPDHPAICFHPSNLRWVLAEENLSKNDTIYSELIEKHNLQWIIDKLNLNIDKWNSNL